MILSRFAILASDVQPKFRANGNSPFGSVHKKGCEDDEDAPRGLVAVNDEALWDWGLMLPCYPTMTEEDNAYSIRRLRISSRSRK